MKKIASSIVLLICCEVTVCDAQEPIPTLLIHAAHCLEVKHFLPPLNNGVFTFGYFLDEHSYPNDKVIYVVAFENPRSLNGTVFALFLSANDGREVLNIQNNASFAISKSERLGVSFIHPPLGGIWTQEHLASAIQSIEQQPRSTVSEKDLLATADVTCESYSDN